MADPKVVALRAQLREAKSDAKRQKEVKKVMEGLLIKTEKQVAREESAEPKHTWKKERFATTPSPQALATKLALSTFQFKAGKKYFVCVACKRTFGSKQALSRHRQQQHTALGKRWFKCPTCTYTGVRRGEVVNRHIRNHHPHLVGKVSHQDLQVYAPSSPVNAVVNSPQPGPSGQWREEDPLKSPTHPQEEELPSNSPTLPQETKKSPSVDIERNTTSPIAPTSIPIPSQRTVTTSPLIETKDLNIDKAIQTGSKGQGQNTVSTQTARNRNHNQWVQTGSTGAKRLDMVLVRRTSQVEVRPDGI